MEASSPEGGAALSAEYTLEDELGDTTGRVFRARRKRDGRLFVVRTFDIVSPPMAAEFATLAQTASRTRHPILASVEAFGRDDDGSAYLVSEYVTGQKLDDWADEVGIPPLGQIVEMVRRLCLGLQAAARSGLTHDAINPRNIVVLQATQGTGPRLPIKLLDLGVPAFLGPSDPRAQALRFMSPEQLAALASNDRAPLFRTTASMNVYSCGCLLYYLCTGGPPYTGSTIEELRLAQRAGRLAPALRINPQISSPLNALILRALALEPSERFGSVADLADALANVVSTLQPFGRGSSPSNPAVRIPVAPVPNEPQIEEDDPPTFKTARPPELLQTPPHARPEHEVPTVPPAPPSAAEAAAIAAGAPIGLFSSAPPFQDRTSPVPPAPRGVVDRASPAALFSMPPPPSAARENTASIIVAEGEPIGSQLVGPYDPRMLPRGQKRRALRPALIWPLAVLACVAAYFGVRRFTTSAPPLATSEPAAHGGGTIAPEVVAPPAIPTERAARPTPTPSEPIEAPAAIAPTERVDTSSRRVQAAAQVAAADRRDHGHSRPSHHESHNEHAATIESSHESQAAETPIETPIEPEHEREAEDASAHAHAAATNVDKAPEHIVAEPAPAPIKPIADKAGAPQPVWPLHAKVEIEAVEVHGSLPTSLVKRAVERIRSQLTDCYARAAMAAGHNGFGAVSVHVEIDERGRARSPSAHGGSLPRLDGCVSDVASKLVSEKAPDTGTVSASWKVNFTP